MNRERVLNAYFSLMSKKQIPLIAIIGIIMLGATQATYGAGCTAGQLKKLVERGFSKTDIQDLCGGAQQQSGSAMAAKNPTNEVQPVANGQENCERGKAAYAQKNYAEAMEWYQKASDQGNAEAPYLLGFMYSQGLGLRQDYAEAIKWYRKAADQGNSDAMVALASLYHLGNGVRQDIAEAMKWYQKAADLGNKYVAEVKRLNLDTEELQRQLPAIEQASGERDRAADETSDQQNKRHAAEEVQKQQREKFEEVCSNTCMENFKLCLKRSPYNQNDHCIDQSRRCDDKCSDDSYNNTANFAAAADRERAQSAGIARQANAVDAADRAQIVGIVAQGLGNSAATAAQGQAQVPSKPWSSWTQQEQAQVGARLKNQCGMECQSYTNAARNSQRGAYEAAACTIACFVNNMPADWPSRSQNISAARENYNNAKRLGSNASVFLRGDR